VSTEWLDDDGYPSDAALAHIEKWEGPLLELFALVRSIWQYADIGYWSEEDAPADFPRKGTVRRFLVSTGGWSGNESIIRAMQKNRYVWHFSWVQSRRGGHYIFEVAQPAPPPGIVETP